MGILNDKESQYVFIMFFVFFFLSLIKEVYNNACFEYLLYHRHKMRKKKIKVIEYSVCA